MPLTLASFTGCVTPSATRKSTICETISRPSADVVCCSDGSHSRIVSLPRAFSSRRPENIHKTVEEGGYLWSESGIAHARKTYRLRGPSP